MLSIQREVNQRMLEVRERIAEVFGGEGDRIARLKGERGIGSRKISKKEKAVRLSMKPGRKCGKCHEIGHHDSRNCKKVKEKTNQRQSESGQE